MATDDFSSLFAFLPIGAYRMGPDGLMQRANPALVRLSGQRDEAELLEVVNPGAVDWYVQPGRRAEFRRLLDRDGQVRGFESEVRGPGDGRRLWISEHAHAVRNAQGQLLFYEGTVEEITDRVRARERLERSERDLRAITAQVPGMVFRVRTAADGLRHIDFVSEGARTLLGLEPAALRQDIGLLHRLRHAQDRTRVQTTVACAVAAGEALAVEYRVCLADGREKWVHQTSAVAGGPQGTGQRVGVIFDISERKQAEALRAERDLAAAADRAKSAFLSRVSHELRTPLNAVLGFSQLLELEPGDGERQRSWVAQVLRSGRHLLALMDDVLDLSSAQTGQLAVAAEPLPLQPLLEEACGMLSGAAAAAAVTVHDETQAQPVLTLRGDRKRVLQVLSNLLSNAIKYNRAGGWVRLRAQRVDGAVQLSVADSGPGLSAAQRTRLFEPFERLDAHRGPVPGTGLGLTLSRQFAQAMGGGIEVDSEPGQGAVFRLWLPAAEPPVPA